MFPTVTIVGRTNVGKSSLLNCLAGERISIVEDQPGVTRDRISALITRDSKTFELIDTGGFGLEKKAELVESVEDQIIVAMEEADLILFVVDGRVGLNPLDQDVAQRIRELDKPTLLVINKIDDPEMDNLSTEFYSLGLDAELIQTSALSNYNRRYLMNRIVEEIDWSRFDLPQKEREMKLAIVGRQNVGKSTFINALAQEERVIVSPLAGTTRDAVDVRFEMEGKSFIAIDTAGMKRKSRLKDSVEYFSYVRAEKAIRRANVVVFMLDVSADITRTDKKLGQMIVESKKPVVIAVNKWDLAEGQIEPRDYVKYLGKLMPGLDFAPVVFLTAQTGERRELVIEMAEELFEQSQFRVGTGELNRLLKLAWQKRKPRPKGGKIGKVLYGTQVEISPPTFVIFVNYKELFTNQYIRYLENYLRDELKFSEIPLRISLKERSRRDISTN